MLQYPLVYIVNYILGSIILYFLVSILSVSKNTSAIIVAIILVPLSYIMNKVILMR